MAALYSEVRRLPLRDNALRAFGLEESSRGW
jgi:hypothetical protein